MRNASRAIARQRGQAPDGAEARQPGFLAPAEPNGTTAQPPALSQQQLSALSSPDQYEPAPQADPDLLPLRPEPAAASLGKQPRRSTADQKRLARNVSFALPAASASSPPEVRAAAGIDADPATGAPGADASARSSPFGAEADGPGSVPPSIAKPRESADLRRPRSRTLRDEIRSVSPPRTNSVHLPNPQNSVSPNTGDARLPPSVRGAVVGPDQQSVAAGGIHQAPRASASPPRAQVSSDMSYAETHDGASQIPDESFLESSKELLDLACGRFLRAHVTGRWALPPCALPFAVCQARSSPGALPSTVVRRVASFFLPTSAGGAIYYGRSSDAAAMTNDCARAPSIVCRPCSCFALGPCMLYCADGPVPLCSAFHNDSSCDNAFSARRRTLLSACNASTSSTESAQRFRRPAFGPQRLAGRQVCCV
jgi:hypothetical protein